MYGNQRTLRIDAGAPADGAAPEIGHPGRLLARHLVDLPPHRALVRSIESVLMGGVALR